MASLDIESLFTNIPLEEVIDICCNQLFLNKTSINGLNKRDLNKLLRLATQENIFMFNGNYYKQKDGVAMGSPLGPILANIFLCYHEKRWLEKCPSHFKPLVYKRHVENIFVYGQNKNEVISFFQYMNNQHNNINFTIETEQENTLAFLDIHIEKAEN